MPILRSQHEGYLDSAFCSRHSDPAQKQTANRNVTQAAMMNLIASQQLLTASAVKTVRRLTVSSEPYTASFGNNCSAACNARNSENLGYVVVFSFWQLLNGYICK